MTVALPSLLPKLLQIAAVFPVAVPTPTLDPRLFQIAAATPVQVATPLLFASVSMMVGPPPLRKTVGSESLTSLGLGSPA